MGSIVWLTVGSEVVVIASCGAATAIESIAVLLCGGELASVTVTLNVVVPPDVGVPLTMPLVASTSPTGSEPDVTVHEYGGVPPDAWRVKE